MRARIAVCLLIGLAGCHREPDFDEKYRQQSAQAMAAASSMEHDLQQRLDVSAAAGHAVTPAEAVSGADSAPQ